jgi:PAS domain S-box-containing protein
MPHSVSQIPDGSLERVRTSELLERFDWAATALGPRESWPASLRTVVQLVLSAPTPMIVRWGRQCVQIYNDAYAPLIGEKHPFAFGATLYDCWPEFRDVQEPIQAKLARGETVSLKDRPSRVPGGGTKDEAYFSVTYIPLRDESGAVGGSLGMVTETTANVVAEQRERRKQLQTLAAVVENSTDFIGVSTPQGIPIFVNEAGRRMIGLAESEIGQHPVIEYFWPDDRALIETVGVPTLVRDGHFSAEVRFRHFKTGEAIPTMWNAFVIRDETSGEPIAWATVSPNLSHLKDVEAKLRAREEQLRLGLMAGNTGTWDWDIVNNRVSWSEQIYKFHALAPEQWGGRVEDFGPLIHPDDRQRVTDAVNRAVNDRGPYRVEYRTVHPNGDVRWIFTTGEVFYDETGKPIRMSGAASDITDRKMAEEALRVRTDQVIIATEAAELGTWDFHPLTGQLWWSDRCKAFFGLPTDANITYQTFVDGCHPDDRERMDRMVTEAIDPNGPGVIDAEYRVVSPDGTQRWLRTNGRTIFKDGVAVRFIGTVQDVTRHRLEQQERDRLLADAQNARAEAEAASKAKDQFLAVLSHELRTPLTPVVMSIAALEHDPDLPRHLREDVSMIRRNIELESKLIDDLLDLSRITSGKLRLHPQPMRLHELVKHVLASARSDTLSKRLEIREDMRAVNDHVHADSARVQQILWNLIRNAIKFTPHGRTISVSSDNAGEDGSQIRVTVSDQGIGITPEQMPRIFDAFEQADMHITRQFGGLGLGLTIAKRLANLHGGMLEARSAGAGCGAMFTLTLPTIVTAQREQAEVASSPARAAREQAQQANDAAIRVLLVEDHIDTQRMLARLLKASGYDVATAGSVADALQKAAAERFDVLISDIGLPDATGYELMRQIRQRYEIPGIALSGYGMEDDVRRGREAGFTDHIVKPISLAQLSAVITNVTRRG